MPVSITAGKFGIRAGIWPPKFEMRSNLQDPERWLVELAGGSPTGSGQTITERIAMQLTAVHCCVDLIANSLAGAPLGVFEKLPNDTRRVADNHRLVPILKRPNEEMTGLTFRRTLIGHLLLWGNAYAEIERNGAGLPVALWPLRPDRVIPRRDTDGSLVYDCRADYGGTVTLDDADVLHYMSYTYDGLRGVTPIGLHRETLGLTMAAGDYGARFFGNDARPGGMMTPTNPVRKEQRDRVKRNWEEGHRGSGNAWRVAIMEQDWKWQTIGIPNEDAQFLQTRVFQLSEIARIYHVPLHKLSELSHATFSNIEHQSIEYVTDAVLPHAHTFEEEDERKLLLPAEQDRFYIEHNLSGLMRGDMKSRFDAYHVALNDGVYVIDDVLKLENMNPASDGEGNVRFIPVTLQPISRALQAPVPADPTAPTPPAASGGSGPGKPTPAPPAPKDQQNSLALQRTHLARAFAHSLEVAGERICRKEKAALERAFGYRTQETRTSEFARFFDTHGEYVEEAFQPILSRLHQAIAELEGREAKPLENYVRVLAHRYVEDCRKHIVSVEAIKTWSEGLQKRCEYEATRAANYFAGVTE